MKLIHQNLLEQISFILENKQELTDSTQSICSLLHEQFPHYDWVGFYWAEGNTLHLGSFAGNPTEHTQIPFGKGICGQVAESLQTMIVDDVSASDNYIACSIDVRSEIVVPILKNDQFIGQIDIDSHQLNAFSSDDQQFLENVCAKITEWYFAD